jgi:hypothetical protein
MEGHFMAAPASAPQTWRCPGCGKQYRIAAGRKAPALCPGCRITRAAEPDESSAFDLLSAIVQAEEEKPSLTARTATRPVEPTAPVQREPSPFEQMLASTEIPEPPAASNEPSQVTVADAPPEDAAVTRVLPPRQISRGQRRVIIVMGMAIAVLAAWGLFRIVGQLEAGIPSEAAVWKQAKIEIADRLPAPATAEFPKPGEIRSLQGTKNPSWTVKSVVDATNERGIPVLYRWFLEISYDRMTRQWATAWIELDDQRVYASRATIREEREDAEKRAAAEKERERERTHRERKKPRVTTAKQTESVSSPDEEVRPDPDREARRERGQWAVVADFEGVGRYESKPFRVTAGGWRFRWTCDGDATIRLYDSAGKLVGEEIEVYSGDRGTQFIRKRAGAFTIKIDTDDRWLLVVEE